MRFKKIYIEITNACNLSCPFCIKNKRKINYITLDNYKLIINKIKPYTKEIYLHILGEPLLHTNIIGGQNQWIIKQCLTLKARLLL